jgi:hypothetical protein
VLACISLTQLASSARAYAICSELSAPGCCAFDLSAGVPATYTVASQEAHLYTTISVAREQDIADNQNFRNDGHVSATLNRPAKIYFASV